MAANQLLAPAATEKRRVSFDMSETEKCEEGRSLGVFTSGGDSQGMNAALRAVVRMARFKGMRTFFIKEGYQGLVEGGDHIQECTWSDVSYIMQKGGTVIGTARCAEFRQREGRLKAAKNLVQAGINNLVVIGGDGSLTGANLFKEEWTGLLEELVKTGRLEHEERERHGHLNIVGLVGSIDNDMCGTDMTIGVDTALHRIIEAIDCITSTASSHQRSFVLEVMGRHCGYLALMAGVAVGADWVLIPEDPPKTGWEEAMCQKLNRCREHGRRLNLVILAEGAVDEGNEKITADRVKKAIENKLGLDTRITVLGHVQRGGKPSAYDRILSTRMGAAASLALIRAQGEIPSIMIAIQGNEIVEVPLMEHVEKTRSIDRAMKNREFEEAKKLRGSSFCSSIRILKTLESCDERGTDVASRKYRLAIMNVGAPAAGVNSATRAFVRLLHFRGHTVLGIYQGFEGLVGDDCVHEMKWMQVSEWGSTGGSNLGTNRTKPTKATLPIIAKNFKANRIQALLIIGGFEAYESLIMLEEARKDFPSLQIPMLLVAATVSNNVPGTEYSLGCDTALNMIVTACDTLKQSATASRKRVFVVETMGGYCGYLATMGALASGADSAYIFEEKFSVKDLEKDVDHLINKFKHGMERGIILRNENCNQNYTTDFICNMLSEEGKEHFVTRTNVLGHLQQGDRPSPFDRILGTKYASAAARELLSQLEENTDGSGEVVANTHKTASVLGLVGLRYVCSPVEDLRTKTDFKHRIPKGQWWMQLRPLIRVLSRHKEDDFKGERHRWSSPRALLASQMTVDQSTMEEEEKSLQAIIAAQPLITVSPEDTDGHCEPPPPRPHETLSLYSAVGITLFMLFPVLISLLSRR